MGGGRDQGIKGSRHQGGEGEGIKGSRDQGIKGGRGSIGAASLPLGIRVEIEEVKDEGTTIKLDGADVLGSAKAIRQ